MIWARVLAFSTGLLSLSLEILWVRLFGFANHSKPQAFAFVLVVYLLGIAFGALIGKRFCKSNYNLWEVCGFILIISSLINLFGPLTYAQFANYTNQLIAGFLILFATGLLPAIIFPIAHHIGTTNVTTRVGSKVSRIYVANILGCTLGPWFTVVLLAYFSTQQCFIFFTLLALAIALCCLIPFISPLRCFSLIGLAFVLIIPLSFYHPHYLIAQLSGYTDRIRRIIENQYGIIVIYAGGEKGDFIFGGNVYDGGTNLNPITNSNKINRVIILSSIQDNPKNVLLIGLSIGTWLKLISTFPRVKNIDVVEINPGYLDAIRDYPQQSEALQDERVHLYIDDIKHWLKTHPKQQYDLIIMNTTFHWRAYSSYLLSQDFLQILKSRMLPGAILAYNTTDSPDAFKTATTVFSHAYLYENFVIAADFDWRQRLRDSKSVGRLMSLSMDGYMLFPSPLYPVLDSYINEPTLALPQVEAKTSRPLEVITDQNLITEYKYGRWLQWK